MTYFSAPADLNGDALGAELTAVLGQPVRVLLIGDEIELLAGDPVDGTKARQVIAAHVL